VTLAPPSTAAGRRGWLLVLAAALVWSAWGAGAAVNPDGWPVAQRFLAGAVQPDLSAEFLTRVGSAALVTLAYAVLGTALSVLLGFAGGPVLSRTWWGRATAGWLGARAALALPRGLHEAVWGLLLVNVLGHDPLVGVLAIAIPCGAVTAKVYADLLDEAPHGPYDALRAAGSGRVGAWAYGLLPHTAADMLSYAVYRFDCAVRAAVILGIVGAGGLGFLLEASFQALDHDRLWTVVYALAVLCGLSDALGRRLRAGRGGRAALLVTAGAVVWAWAYLRIDPTTLWEASTRGQVSYVVAHAWPPATDVPALLRLAAETLQMSVLAIVLAAGAAVAVAPLAARPRPGAGLLRRGAGAACRAVLLLLRAVPAPAWALVLLFVLIPGPLPGALALAAYNLGVLGRLMAEVVENLDPAPARALTAPGPVVYAYGVLPRALPRFLAYGLYRWEVTVRETVIVGLVGAGGLGYALARQTAAFDWHAVTGTLLTLVALTFAVDMVSAAVRRAVH
jgi:phosphonate transport system permease protein